jgi:MtN3 and saliva related transmembrane protein
MDYVIISGLIAGSLTTFSYLPQLLKALKTKSTRDLSVYWLAALTLGLVFWIAYGYFISSFPVIFFNVILIIITIWLLILKFKYR